MTSHPGSMAFAATLAAILVTGSVHASDALQAKQRVEVADTPEGVWQQIGDFCSIVSWHPAVEACELSDSDGDTLRTLTLADGGVIVDKLLGPGETDTSYRYSVVEGPLPIKNYVGTFEVDTDDDGAGIKWTGEFVADGVSNEEAIDLMEGIFASGLEGVVALYQ